MDSKDKWYYIKKIQEYSTSSNDYLLKMLNTYKKFGLKDITYNDARIFWNNLKRKYDL